MGLRKSVEDWEKYWLAFSESILTDEVIRRPRHEIEELVKDVYYFYKGADSIDYTEPDNNIVYNNANRNSQTPLYPYFFGRTNAPPGRIGETVFTPLLFCVDDTLEKLKKALPNLRHFEYLKHIAQEESTLLPGYQIRFLDKELKEILDRAKNQVLLPA